ncbi:MAG: 4-hydroxy-3-methylbut-2-enyl diphosphate reductase [Treponema sp.]|nr:4-hydroxy-3-methylbut-2-enyl diphosphate reductase [Treponema sp.]
MPQVIRAKVLGYCFGARCAVYMALEARREHPGRTVVTFGPIIHNPVAARQLEDAGIFVLKDPLARAEPGGIVIIRAHGVPPSVRDELAAAGWTVFDATCPRIRESQKKARTACQKGFRVIIAGDKKHAEITGIRGYAPDAVVVENVEEAARAAALLGPSGSFEKTVLIGQTTLGRDEYREIAKALALPGLLVHNTICPATLERQEALRRLCPQVDGVLVIGGKDSANTRRLLELARQCGSPAALVEDSGGIPAGFFSLPRVGLSAGASTPDEVINEVESALLRGKSEM